MSPKLPVKEGHFQFVAPIGEECRTWYKIVGNIGSARCAPLITLHGGPGAGHDYLSPLSDLCETYEIPVVYYDQVGCGRSTHFRNKSGDESFWTFELFIKELQSLIDHLRLTKYHILGQSWGGILGTEFAAQHPPGLQKLILASGPASIPEWIKGANKLLSELPPDVRKTLEDCERRGDYESPEYEKAAAVYYGKHLCRLDPWPADLLAAFENLSDDKTAYLTMQGPSEFTITGTLKDWEGWKFGHKIQAETLLLNGRYDEAVDDCVSPWLRTIPKVKWVTLENASHMGQWEDRDRFVSLCGMFLITSPGAL
ncbi:Alpha/Beta hydrolase protein [Xylariaceae sp. FL1272]|nr:Alpha/Beta hydrolase protein [Xylariaceae sp. FL1272]